MPRNPRKPLETPTTSPQKRKPRTKRPKKLFMPYYARQDYLAVDQYLKTLSDVEQGKKPIRVETEPEIDLQPEPGPSHVHCDDHILPNNDHTFLPVDDDYTLLPVDDDSTHTYLHNSINHRPKGTKHKRKKIGRVEALYTSWKALVPTLVDSYLRYFGSTRGEQKEDPGHLEDFPCSCPASSRKERHIRCYFWDREHILTYPHFNVLNTFLGVEYRKYKICSCSPSASLPARMVEQGLFPASPTYPKAAVSIKLLEMFTSLRKASGISIAALRDAMSDFYRGMGYYFRRKNVSQSSILFIYQLGKRNVSTAGRTFDRCIQTFSHHAVSVFRNIEENGIWTKR